MNKTLYYAHDPMCSWCWGFESVRKVFFKALPNEVTVVRLVGGLAPDSSEPMPHEMQLGLQNIWKNIQRAIPGTVFNFDFWSNCKPRRSTYPSNRAVLAAKKQGDKFDELMTHRIQQAYYTEAKNPSDNAVLIQLANDINLNVEQFEHDLHSPAIQKELLETLSLARQLGLTSFPSLLYQVNDSVYPIQLDYNDANNLIAQIHAIDKSILSD